MYIVLDIQLYMNECFYFFFRKEGKRILHLSCNDDLFLFNYLADFSYFSLNLFPESCVAMEILTVTQCFCSLYRIKQNTCFCSLYRIKQNTRKSIYYQYYSIMLCSSIIYVAAMACWYTSNNSIESCERILTHLE